MPFDRPGFVRLCVLMFALGIVPAWFMRLGRPRTPNRPW